MANSSNAGWNIISSIENAVHSCKHAIPNLAYPTGPLFRDSNSKTCPPKALLAHWAPPLNVQFKLASPETTSGFPGASTSRTLLPNLYVPLLFDAHAQTHAICAFPLRCSRPNAGHSTHKSHCSQTMVTVALVNKLMVTVAPFAIPNGNCSFFFKIPNWPALARFEFQDVSSESAACC